MKKVCIIGLGYAGLHTAIAFGKRQPIIGFDINKEKIKNLKQGYDQLGLFSKEELAQAQIEYSCDPNVLKQANFYIVIVPTPSKKSRAPEFKYLVSASKMIGRCLKKGDVVVYESTVYPGATEEICLPILEKESGFKVGVDFELGYSPERVNPGDPDHTFDNTVKLVSGNTKKALAEVEKVYSEVVGAGVYGLSSIMAAEVAKLIENSQRDVNIAFMNEVTVVMDRLGLDAQEVLKAASTKWNFLGFKPGFVGGHCISVVPYHFIHKSEIMGYTPELMIVARKVNENMPVELAEKIVKTMLQSGKPVLNSKVAILGIAYKENTKDIRNSKVVALLEALNRYNIEVQVCDPVVDQAEVQKAYGVELASWDQIQDVSAIVMAVGHDEFKSLTEEDFLDKFKAGEKGLLFDVPGVLSEAVQSEKLAVREI